MYLATVGKWLDGSKLDEISGTVKLILTNIPKLLLNGDFLAYNRKTPQTKRKIVLNNELVLNELLCGDDSVP